MPSLRTRTQQPTPVSPQVQVPSEFPAIPQEVLDRFPSAADWGKRLDAFWTTTKQALQEAQAQTANFTNSRVTFSVDTFTIYAKNGIPQPMFFLDGTGIRLGNVLVINTPGRKVYIGAGNYQNDDTPFYIDTLGKFSLGASLTWDPETSTLTVTGTIVATSGTIGGFNIGADYIRDAANSFGLASTITGGDDVRFWAGATFANRATAPIRIYESGGVTIAGGSVTIATTNRLVVSDSVSYLTWQGPPGLNVPGIFLQHETAAGGGVNVFAAGTNAVSAVFLVKSRGTLGAPTAIGADDVIGSIAWQSYNGATSSTLSQLRSGITASTATPYALLTVGGVGNPNYYVVLNYDGKLYFLPESFTGPVSSTYGAPYTSDFLTNIYYSAAGAIKTDGTFIAAVGFSGPGSLLTALSASALSSGTVPTARLGSGAAGATTFLRGDQTWATPSSAGFLTSANNLSDVASAATSRSNLGVTATGADTTYSFRANNLSDLANATTARNNLGLGTMATQASSAVAITGGSVDNCNSNGFIYPGIGGTNRIAFLWSGTNVKVYVDGSVQGTIPNP